MSSTHEMPMAAGHGVLALSLEQCATASLSGVLRVVGRPGGAFHFRHGLVISVDSPGAPGPETLLTRSGRLNDEDRLGARGHVGAAEFYVIRLMATLDATFAIIAGQMEGCTPYLQPELPPERGEDPGLLLREAARRLDALATLPRAVSPERERVVAVSGALDGALDGALPAARKEILLLADGRRSARDIAFATGRGLYAVTVEVSRMLGEGLLTLVTREAAPFDAPENTTVLRPRGPQPPVSEVPAPAVLPRRRRETQANGRDATGNGLRDLLRFRGWIGGSGSDGHIGGRQR